MLSQYYLLIGAIFTDIQYRLWNRIKKVVPQMDYLFLLRNPVVPQIDYQNSIVRR